MSISTPLFDEGIEVADGPPTKDDGFVGGNIDDDSVEGPPIILYKQHSKNQ